MTNLAQFTDPSDYELNVFEHVCGLGLLEAAGVAFEVFAPDTDGDHRPSYSAFLNREQAEQVRDHITELLK